MNGSLIVTRWHVGGTVEELEASDGVVALQERDLSLSCNQVRLAVSLPEAAEKPMPRAPKVRIALPAYRGKRLVPVLGWLTVERLAQPRAAVSWLMTKNQGPDSIRKLLAEDGWDLEKTREGHLISLHGEAPSSARWPHPRSFTTDLGIRRNVELLADYGVFSPDHVDEGTALLLEVALNHPRVSRVADIGIGYGALAIGLVLNGVAQSAIGSDVDAISLWLAEQNARANRVPLDLTLTADPTAVEPTPLTVCNVPTHISTEETAHFMAALAERAKQGYLLIVVHTSLKRRYMRYLAGIGGVISQHPGTSHTVLGVAG